MAKAKNQNTTTTSSTNTKKQRNKQAKQEAKVMLKIEAARQDVQKAERKVAKAQAHLEASHAHLRDLETRSSADISTPSNQLNSQPPAEGRADTLQDNVIQQ